MEGFNQSLPYQSYHIILGIPSVPVPKQYAISYRTNTQYTSPSYTQNYNKMVLIQGPVPKWRILAMIMRSFFQDFLPFMLITMIISSILLLWEEPLGFSRIRYLLLIPHGLGPRTSPLPLIIPLPYFLPPCTLIQLDRIGSSAIGLSGLFAPRE